MEFKPANGVGVSQLDEVKFLPLFYQHPKQKTIPLLAVLHREFQRPQPLPAASRYPTHPLQARRTKRPVTGRSVSHPMAASSHRYGEQPCAATAARCATGRILCTSSIG